MSTVTKKDLASLVAEKCGCPRNTALNAVQSFLDQIIAELSKGNRIELRDFGVFETRTRTGHTARNPRTKQVVSVPLRVAVRFKPGRVMKAQVQQLVQAPPTI